MKLKNILCLFIGVLIINGCDGSSSGSKNNDTGDKPELKAIEVTTTAHNAITIAAPQLAQAK